jgi:hypothetical protein
MNARWNNGDLTLSPIRMQRVSTDHQEVVAARPQDVFPLAYPVAEALLRTQDLLQRPGPEMLVYPTLVDGERRRFHAFLACGDLVAGKFELELDDTDDGRALVRLSLILTALSPQGNALYTQGLGDRMRNALARIGKGLGQVRRMDPRVLAADQVRREQRAGLSASATHQIVVRGDPDECFALACPVVELDWIEGWCFDLIYSESGRNEDNVIFLEPMSGLGVLRCPGANTYWYTTLYDTLSRRFHAVLLTPDFMIARFRLEIDEMGEGQARMRWSLTYAGLNEKGQRIAAEPGFGRRAFGMLDLLARSAKHYVETGAMYRMPAGERARVLLSVIGAAVGRHARRFWQRLAGSGRDGHDRGAIGMHPGGMRQ